MFQTKHVIKTLPLERMNKPNRINSKDSNDRRVKKIFMGLHLICMRQTHLLKQPLPLPAQIKLLCYIEQDSEKDAIFGIKNFFSACILLNFPIYHCLKKKKKSTNLEFNSFDLFWLPTLTWDEQHPRRTWFFSTDYKKSHVEKGRSYVYFVELWV